MTQPIVSVEQDRELEIPASVIGEALPAGTQFFVQDFSIPAGNTVGEQRIFVLIQKPERRPITPEPQCSCSLVFPLEVPETNEVFGQTGHLVLSKPVANLG